jgi:hypothetical protein
MPACRHTGIRIEELLELTQLSLHHYTSSTTGTLVPLLHIVPSKTDAERLILMTPELVTVLVAVQRRAKGRHDQVPLSVRYDPSEKVHGEPFPHLFECSKEIWEAVSDRGRGVRSRGERPPTRGAP